MFCRDTNSNFLVAAFRVLFYLQPDRTTLINLWKTGIFDQSLAHKQVLLEEAHASLAEEELDYMIRVLNMPVLPLITLAR
jgi:hypothetical protein